LFTPNSPQFDSAWGHYVSPRAFVSYESSDCVEPFSHYTNPYNISKHVERMRKISVGEVMTRKVISVKPEDSLHKCAKVMAKERINSILVIEEKKLIGILTARDILWAMTKKGNTSLKKIKCIDIATRKIAVIKPSSEISEAVNKMKYSNFRRLPVLSKGELIGVLTLKDILAVEPGLYGETKSLMDNIREEETKLERIGKKWPLEGICENCGAFSDLLKVDEILLCQDCREEMY
jgi:CBS domain-containing protein